MNNLRDIFENLTKEIEAQLAKVTDLEAREGLVNQSESVSQRKSLDADRKLRDMDNMKADLEKQKDFLDKEILRYKELNSLSDSLKESQVQLSQREKLLADKVTIMSRKLEDLKTLEVRETEVNSKEELLKKTSIANLIRQQELDAREMALKNEATRLQRIAETYKV